MIVGVTKEKRPGEMRVALVPSHVPSLQKAGFVVKIEKGAGESAGFTDAMYEEEGVKIATRKNVFGKADVILQVHATGSDPKGDAKDLEMLRDGQIVIGLLDPLSNPEIAKSLSNTKASTFAMELVPRITRAQSMDVLSSQANIAGYKAALIAAEKHTKMFPMMMTAAGTITPAKVLVIGAGVAGLQAIATCNRLGAVVSAYDIRPAVKEQVESLGAKFVELELETGEAEDKGGYAKAMDEEFYKKQRELMAKVLAEHDTVITTAAVPGKQAPTLVTEEMLNAMKPGSVIIDLAAEQGGNCSLTEAGKTVDHNGVHIIGPVNVPSTVPYHASQMYSKNLCNLLTLMVKEEKLEIDKEDEIIRDTLVTEGGKIVNERIKETFGL